MNTRTINANTQERKASEVARYGNRYYPVDKSYDKRVYENDWCNIFRIIGTLFAFWIVNSLHWWGVFSLGIVASDSLAWYSIGCFFFTVIFLGCLLCSGRVANKLKRQHEFYVEKIAERRAEAQEKETVAIQEKIHKEKLEMYNAKLAEIVKAAEAEEAAAAAANNNAGGKGFIQTVVTHIQGTEPAPARDNRLIQPDTRA